MSDYFIKLYRFNVYRGFSKYMLRFFIKISYSFQGNYYIFLLINSFKFLLKNLNELMSKDLFTQMRSIKFRNISAIVFPCCAA